MVDLDELAERIKIQYHEKLKTGDLDFFADINKYLSNEQRLALYEALNDTLKLYRGDKDDRQ